MPDFMNASVQEYLDRLASGDPTPGGGSAAGLAGAMGAALLCMSARFTVGRERYKAFEEAAAQVIDEAEALRAGLQRSMEEDATAYATYGTALALPKATDEEKAARRQALQEATKVSALVPLAIAKQSFRLLELAVILAKNCNPYLLSDVAVAAHLALSAFRSAVINVRINLQSLEDAEFVASIDGELRPLEERAGALARMAIATALPEQEMPEKGV